MKQKTSQISHGQLPLHAASSSILINSNQNENIQHTNPSSFLITTASHSQQQGSTMLSSQINNKKSLNQIQQLYTQIHTTINDMDSKVQHVIKKHQAQFLFAYRSHIKKIKKQLSEIKYKSEEQEKMFSSNDRIQYLEKQLAIFRQQTMKLYNKLDQKNAQIDILRIKLKDSQKQAAHSSAQLKEQVKKNKFQEMNKLILQQKLEKVEKQLEEKKFEIKSLNQKFLNTIEDNKSSIKAAGSLGSGTKLSAYQHLKKLEYSKTSPLNSQRKSPSRTTNPLALGTSSHFYSKIPQSPRIYQTDLKQWFLECIKTVKREIAQRNNNQKSLQLNNITSIQEFMMIDKLRLLQIFLQNQRLLSYMYERIFPDRLSVLRQKLSQTKITNNNSTLPRQPALHTQKTQRQKQRQRTSSFNINQQLINDRYKTQHKISYLPKVVRTSEHKKLDKNYWKGNIVLKDGKLNISIQ